MKCIAFFDFDGTITNRDTVIDFLKFVTGKYKFYKKVIPLMPLIIAYYLKLISNKKIKEKLFTTFLKGMFADKFYSLAKKYALKRIPQLERKEVTDRIQWHKDKKHEVFVVSASMREWLAPWCTNHKVKFIANTFEVEQGRLTGKIQGPNCYGKEKLRQIEQKFNLPEYDFIFAYGDSKSDLPMLQVAQEKYYKNFKSFLNHS